MATSRLDRFSLDFFGPRVTQVLIGGEAVAFGRGQGKLRVLPEEPIATESRFEVEIRYIGTPPTIVDANSSREGWRPDRRRGLRAGGAAGDRGLDPLRQRPVDKASFAFDVTVPQVARW